MNLTIIRIKPNPTGKDRPRHGTLDPSQLAGEWVDFRNDGTQGAPLNSVVLYHRAYRNGQAHWARVTGFSGVLPIGEIVRVHAGRVRDLTVIRPEDRAGADHHIFSGEDEYVWNNREGDQPLLNYEPTNQTIDTATYDANPPEGTVLVRQGTKLIAAAKAVNW
jgi:hypothetical protein